MKSTTLIAFYKEQIRFYILKILPDRLFPKIFIFLINIYLFSGVEIQAQTCPYGSPTASTGYGVTATGAQAGAANALGTILAATSTLTTGNSATLGATVATIDIDFERWVAQGSTVTVAWARNAGTPTANVLHSNDGVNFTSIGTLSGSASTASVYANFSVPSGGLRYIRITRTGGTLFVDGIRRTHYCYYPVTAYPDVRVFMNPGRAIGNIGYNDSNIDNDSRRFTLSYIDVTNGTLTFDTFGNYTYVPNSSFEGMDRFSYQVCDAGPDGNINTTNDNSCDTSVVILRALFNCDSTIFYIPIPENEAMDFLEDIQATNADPVQFYTGLSVSSDAIVIYDHWEDGFESDIKAPTQTSTQIWGDADLTNGIAPGFPLDVLDAGRAIILSNSVSTGHNGATSYNPNASGSDATLQGVVDYDGKDKIFIGGIGALAKFVWGTVGTLSVSGSSVPSVSKWDTFYTAPVGQNTTGGGVSFEIVSLSILASKSNTIIRVDRDANGTTDILDTLDEGETRYVDSYFSGSPVAVNQGATVNSNKPVMVTLMTGNWQTASPAYEGRTYSLIPNSQFSTCYYMPAVPQENMRVFFYNPTGSAITVTRTTAGGATSTISVPANASNFQDVNSSGLGYRYCSTVGFAILTSVDHLSATSDWGFIPVPTANLTSKVLMSIGAGVDPTNVAYGTQNLTQALVTVDDTTYLYVDVNGDGSPDNVSFNADVDASDNAVSIGGVNYNETTSSAGILINSYQTIAIGATTGNLNGASVWTMTGSGNTGVPGANIILVWGQNGGAAGAPNIDAGYTVPNVEPFIPNSLVVKSSDSICIGSNIDSITVRYGGTGPYKITWFNETTFTNNASNTSNDTFVIKNLEPGTYLIKVKDANCNIFSQRTTMYEKTVGCSFTISGTMFNDSNGNTDNLINGRVFGDPSGVIMYSYLLNNLDIVTDSSRVLSNGTFVLNAVRNSFYTLRLSNTAVGIGSSAPSASLPSGWVNTAEQYGSNNPAGTGIESGNADGNISVNLISTSVSNVNLGIERQPVNPVSNYTISKPSNNLTDTMYLNRGGIFPGGMTSTDAEDGSLGTGNTIVIYAPSENELFYDLDNDGVLDVGEEITDSLRITSYNPSLLIARYSELGSIGMTFQYTFVDRANRIGTRANYNINWGISLPIEFVNVKGSCDNNNNIVEWAMDANNEKGECVILRSLDAKNWFEIAHIPVEENSSRLQSFKYIDSSLTFGQVYYKVRFESVNGMSKNSFIVNLACRKARPEIVIYPNPNTGLVYVANSNTDQLLDFELVDAIGRVIKVNYKINAGIVELNLKELADGIYTLIIYEEGQPMYVRIEIKR